jgi:hypothetical protein
VCEQSERKGRSGSTEVFLRLADCGFDRVQHLLGREPMACLLARYGDIDSPSRSVTQLVQLLAGLSTPSILSASLTDREDLPGDVFAVISSPR